MEHQCLTPSMQAPSPSQGCITYELKLLETEGSTGYFACVPADPASFQQALDTLRARPFDQFIRDYLLRQLAGEDRATLIQRFQDAAPDDMVLKSLLFEANLRSSGFNSLPDSLPEMDAACLAPFSPLIDIRSFLAVDQALHRQWVPFFQANLQDHRELPLPQTAGLTAPFSKKLLDRCGQTTVTIADIHSQRSDTKTVFKPSAIAPEETSRIALERLDALGVIADQEYRHQASLSPIALLRQWRMDTLIRNNRHHHRLFGLQTSYGRGLDIETARAAYSMEIVERVSAFASVGPRQVEGYKAEHRLVHARHTEMTAQGLNALDPNRLALEVPYHDEPLYWIMGEGAAKNGPDPVWVPVQCIFLFSNLDEISLFSGLGSTGLASGNTMAEARLRALLEVIERDSEAVMPFHPSLCFDLEAQDPTIQGLLDQYHQIGIRIQFQDLTTELGIPCCKCYVCSSQGVAKGTGAHLNARRAILSALTETPYPFPGPPSGPVLSGVTRVPYENLPDYSTGNPASDLMLLEAVLVSNGYEPVYIDLTHGELDLPVVRAIVPGMQPSADLDLFSRISPRLFANYLRLFAA